MHGWRGTVGHLQGGVIEGGSPVLHLVVAGAQAKEGTAALETREGCGVVLYGG